jgi:acetolactate synthase-1/2/3 large subunit
MAPPAWEHFVMIKLSDYVSQFLVEHGIQDIFLVAGGGIMHMLDSVGRQEGLSYWCSHHEQAAAVAAEGYAKYTRKVGACLVTVGPGGVNALSGILGAWMDSVPVMVFSGQVRRDIIADYSKIRQMGPQEADVVSMAIHATKYATTILDPSRIRYELEFALHEATHGRPGPVWIDLPLDVQGAMIDETALIGFYPPDSSNTLELDARIEEALAMLRQAKRPLIIAGNGIHSSRSEKRFLELLEVAGIPAVFPFSAKDLLWEDHPLNMGIFGTAGQRRANFTLQNADCILSLASGLCIAKTGFNVAGFAPKAQKILVDIDPGQLHHQPVKADLAIKAEIGLFMEVLAQRLNSAPLTPDPRWLEACSRWKQRYPIVSETFLDERNYVNTYVFMDKLADHLSGEDTVVTGNGMDIVSLYQTFKVKRGQRTIVTANWGAMGWDLPLAVGTCIGRDRRRTVLVTGDGSMQLNLQELLTIKHNRLPIKIFIFNNHGYSSIRATQNAFFDGRFVGADATSGIADANFEKLADAYGFDFSRLATHGDLEAGISRALVGDQPHICEILVSPEQAISPKASAFRREDGTFESRPLEDMAPFLSREEIWENTHLFDQQGI